MNEQEDKIGFVDWDDLDEDEEDKYGKFSYDEVKIRLSGIWT